MLSLRQVDRLLSQGILPRTKVSANRTGILRVAFDTYLASLHRLTLHTPPCEIAPSAQATDTQTRQDFSVSGYACYRFQTADDCKEFALKADRIGLRGSIARKDDNDHVILKWHRDLGFDVTYLESILTRWSFPFVKTADE